MAGIMFILCILLLLPPSATEHRDAEEQIKKAMDRMVSCIPNGGTIKNMSTGTRMITSISVQRDCETGEETATINGETYPLK